MKRTSQISTYAISVTSTKFLEVLELVALGIRWIRLHFEKVKFSRAIGFHARVRAATICEVAHVEHLCPLNSCEESLVILM